ncbi:hypothetical protein [Bordetella trematum]|uniref:hypothetical protein n=1 Tax=Bordetella trematum TaxID=123899 RepID=UPI000472B683|nr:hypothetical protein [Bordetella trematum]
MAKYRVVRPWHGVSAGQVVELEHVNPAIKANLVPESGGGDDAGHAASLLAQAEAEVEAMRKRAEAELAQRIEEAREQAKAEAKGIIESAHGEAERIKAEAAKQAGELTPATPDATAAKRGRPPKVDSSGE